MKQKKIIKIILSILIFQISFLFLVISLYAYHLPLEIKKQILYGVDSTGIFFQNKPIIRFFPLENGPSVYERAQNTFLAIQQMTALGLTEKDIVLIVTKNQVQAIVQNDFSQPLFFVSQKESDINKTPQLQLAKEWILRIKTIFDWIPNYRNTDYTIWEPREYLPCRGYAKAYQSSQVHIYPYFIAAHPFFPIGTKIRITNIFKKWSIVVTVEERITASDSMVLIEKDAADAIGLGQTPQFVLMEEFR